MEPFRACLAILPLAAYLLVMGWINLRRRPFVTTGARDLYALGVAVCGLVIVGPIELFMPAVATMRFGPFVWVMLLAFYFLNVTFLMLISRPRLVIYNISHDELRPLLGRLVSELDGKHSWAGNSVVMPTLGVQLQIDRFGAMRNLSLTSTATDQSFAGWRHFQERLAAELAQLETNSNPVGVFFVSLSSLLFAASAFWIATDSEAIVSGARNWLQL